MDARTNLFSDIIIGAVEGGTGYWAEAQGYRWSGEDEYPATVELVDITEQGGKRVRLDVVTVANAMFRVANDPLFNVNPTIRGHVVYALATNDAGDCDAEVCDVIAQAAAFGEIVYG